MAERMVHRRHPHHGVLAARAWRFRQSVSFYDALHVALAERLDCPLTTAGKRLALALPHNKQIVDIAGNG